MRAELGIGSSRENSSGRTSVLEGVAPPKSWGPCEWGAAPRQGQGLGPSPVLEGGHVGPRWGREGRAPRTASLWQGRLGEGPGLGPGPVPRACQSPGEPCLSPGLGTREASSRELPRATPHCLAQATCPRPLPCCLTAESRPFGVGLDPLAPVLPSDSSN